MALNGLVIHKPELIDDKYYAKRTKVLKGRLEELSKDASKPSASLFAKTIFLNLKLTEQLFSGQNIDRNLRALKDVVLKSRGLVGYPFKPLIEILTEMGAQLEGSPEYDDLFATILQVSEERDGELSVAKLQLSRGEKLLEA